MKPEAAEILERALKLPPVERACLVEQLLISLDAPDETIDALWRREVERRVAAFRDGRMPSVSLEEVLAKYRR